MEQQQEAMMTEKTMDVVGPAAAEAVKNEVAE